MNSPLPYVPVLRWKGAEITAVLGLTPRQRDQVKPLFEFVPRTFKIAVERAVALRAREIASTWGWDRPCFIDPSLLDPAFAGATYTLLDKEEYLNATLVVGLQPPFDPRLLRGLKMVQKRGLAIRLGAHEMRQAGWRKKLLEIISDADLSADKIDLVVDYGTLADAAAFAQIANAASAVADWRMLVLLAGSFPPDLSKLQKNDEHVLPRVEWQAFVAFSQSGGRAAFGDYTIQHPIFEEHEGKGMNFSASIRYTNNDTWLIMRGESVLTGGFEQWPAHAQLLCEKTDVFSGTDFSEGDAYIARMAAQQANNGTSKDWLAAGINHHVAVTVSQLAHVNDLPSMRVEQQVIADWPARIPTRVSAN